MSAGMNINLARSMAVGDSAFLEAAGSVADAGLKSGAEAPDLVSRRSTRRLNNGATSEFGTFDDLGFPDLNESVTSVTC